VLLTQDKIRATLPKTRSQVITMESDWSDQAPCDPQLTSRNLVYVIYTSGSTGAPKAVMIEHETAVNLLNSMSVQPGIQSGDRLLAVTTLSFDIAALEIFLPLLNGGTIVLATRDSAQDARRLIEILDTNEIS